MRASVRVVSAAGLAMVLASCGVPIQSGAHFTQGWDPVSRGWSPTEPGTFAWHDEEDMTIGDARLRDNRFFHDRLHEAVEWELSLRGLRYDEAAPLHIHHHFTLADHEMEREVVDEAGATSFETEVYEGGSVVLHVSDTRTGEDVWVAWAQANIEPAFIGPDAMRSWVYDIVAAMFSDWPVPSRTAG